MWSALAPLPDDRELLAAAVVNGRLYAVGGRNFPVTVGTLEVYDPVTDTWSTKASMPTARGSVAAGVINDKLYAVGGLPGTSTLATNINEAFTPIGGTVSGVRPSRVTCRNLTTGQTVQISPKGNPSWNCNGLVVNPGDRVGIAVQGPVD